MAEKKITSVEEYRGMVGKVQEITLPSGAVFQVKRLSVMDYINEGLDDIPNDLFKFIGELMTGQLEVKSEENKKNMELFEKFLQITIEKGIVQPLITLKYEKEKKATHLIYAELSVDDQEALVKAITGRK